MYVEEVVQNCSNLMGTEINCTGILSSQDEQFYLESQTIDGTRLTLLITKDNFRFGDYLLLLDFSGASIDRKASIIGLLAEASDKSMIIEPAYLILHLEKYEIRVFREPTTLDKAFPYPFEYKDTIDKSQLIVNDTVTYHLEMTLIGFKRNDDLRFSLTDQKWYEITEPYIVRSGDLIWIEDAPFLSFYTKLISITIPSPTPWLNGVRLKADITKMDDGTCIATNVRDVYIYVSATFYKHIFPV